MKLEKTTNYQESQTDNSNMKQAQREAGKRARKTLHKEKHIKYHVFENNDQPYAV
jgi:hypothetical protein